MVPVCTQHCRNLEPQEIRLGACLGSLPPVCLAQEKAELFPTDHLALSDVLISNTEVGLLAWDSTSETDAEFMCKIWLPAKELIMIASEVVPIVWVRRSGSHVVCTSW